MCSLSTSSLPVYAYSHTAQFLPSLFLKYRPLCCFQGYSYREVVSRAVCHYPIRRLPGASLHWEHCHSEILSSSHSYLNRKIWQHESACNLRPFRVDLTTEICVKGRCVGGGHILSLLFLWMPYSIRLLKIPCKTKNQLHLLVGWSHSRTDLFILVFLLPCFILCPLWVCHIRTALSNKTLPSVHCFLGKHRAKPMTK